MKNTQQVSNSVMLNEVKHLSLVKFLREILQR